MLPDGGMIVKTVQVKVLVSFGNLQRGDTAAVQLNPCVQGWINAGLVEVDGGGEDQAGPGGPEPDDDKRDPLGAAGSESAGGAEGASFGAGPYGAPA